MASVDAIRAGVTAPTPDMLGAMWRNQWKDVPAALCLQIENATDINPNPEIPMLFETIGLTGSYEATRTMVYVDYALGMSRSAYEGNQGTEDFGWNTLIPNWEPPGIFVAQDDQDLTRYDGTTSLAHSRVVAWVNSGILDVKSILNLDSDDTNFVSTDENPDRKGGFGQGAKVMLNLFVANKTDRINALELYLEKNDSHLHPEQRQQIRNAVDKLKLSLEVEGENDTFATVQAKGSDGIYRRTYCYRTPYRSNGRDLWKLRYIVVELDPEKIQASEQDKVIFAVHYPDMALTESLDGMRENMLETDPFYPNKHSLVRDQESDRPTVIINNTRCNLTSGQAYDNDTHYGVCDVERIDRSICQPDRPPVSGKIYFRGTHMIPEEKADMRLIYDYNIAKLDSKARSRVARSSNSSYVSGPITEIVSDTVSQIDKPSDWLRILDLAQEVTSSDYSVYYFPELSPRTIKDWVGKQPVYDALKNAFNLKYPQANQKVARSQSDLDAYREFTGDDTPIPIVSSDRLVDFLSEAGIVDIKATNDELIEKKLLVKHKTGRSEIVRAERVNELIRNSEEYRLIMAGGPIDQDTFIKLAFVQNDIFNFSEYAKSYGIDAPQGKHALLFQFLTGNQIEKLIRQLGHLNKLENSDPRSMAIILAAIDSGIDIRFETTKNAHITTVTQIELSPSGNIVIFSGESLRADSEWSSGSVIIHGKAVDLLKIQNDLDVTIGLRHPDIIESRSENEFSSTLKIINETLSALAPGQTVNAATLENITQILTTAKQAQDKVNATLEKLSGQRKKLTSNNGVINGALLTGDFPGGGRVSKLYREGIMLASSSHSSISILSRDRETIAKRRESGETESFGGNDLKCVLYGNAHHNDLYPVEAYENLEYIEGGMKRSNEYNNLVIAEDPENGPWRYYHPATGPGYLNRISDNYVHYDGFFEFQRELMPVSYEAVLPVDVNKYEIAYIQFPAEIGSEAPIPPVLMYDTVNRQYSLQFSGEDTKEVLKTLPAGTRIYFKVRTPESIGEQPIPEKDLIDNHPQYYKAITTSLIKVDHLDNEARSFIELLANRKPPLNRQETMAAAYRFWNKRRLYDDEGVVCDSIEELIRLGVGVCNEAEPPMTQIPRLFSVPTRTRIAYSDQERQGNLSPPFHAITEYLNDEGQWEAWDPPNSRTTKNYSQKLANQAVAGHVPEVFDSNSLGRGDSRNDVILPDDINLALDRVSVNNGDIITEGAVAILNAKMRGEKVNAHHLVEQLAKEEKGTVETKFQTDPQEIGKVLDLMQTSNRRLDQLQKKYGIGSKQAEEYRSKVAAQLARLLVNSVTVK